MRARNSSSFAERRKSAGFMPSFCITVVSLTAVDDHQLWKRFLLNKGSFILPVHHFFHGGKVINTLNGFHILRAPAEAPSSPEHHFRVRHLADGAEFTVMVAIDPEAVERVVRLTHRRLEPGGAFWRVQAERLLSAYIWSEGQGPPNGRLIVRDVSPEDLEVALRWELG